MPVTARLLQRLREAIGDEATNDLFAWWEEAATVNRTAVREVADLYFAKFDARLEKGLSEVRSEQDKGFALARSDLHQGLAGVRTEVADQRADLIKWMFIFWAGTVVPLAGLLIALTKR
jgi:hypothetical protein